MLQLRHAVGRRSHRTVHAHLPSVSLAALLLLALAAGPVAAQQGAVLGTVVTEEGDPFPFADVFLDGAGNDPFTSAVLTDEEGRFRFSPVPPGTYELYAFASGFRSDKFSNLVVDPGSRRSYEIRLLSQEAEEEIVNVNALIQDLVDVERTDVSMVIQGDFVEKIPLQNKRIQDIAKLFPGVVTSGSSDSADISIGGGTGGQIGFRLNGAAINDPISGGASLDIPTASIESFKLITTGFSARYGEQSTGMAEIVTKGGSNELEFQYGMDIRYSDYGAFELEDLDGVHVFVDDLLRAEGTLLEQELAAGFRLLGVDQVSSLADDNNPLPRRRIRHTISAGGPIIRDKMYFYSTLESLADDTGSAFVDGTLQTDQVLYTGKVQWDVSAMNKLELTFSTDVSETTGFLGLRATEGIDNDSTAGTWTFTGRDTHIIDDRTFLESTLTFTQQYGASRPTDVRTGVGPRFDVLLPPGGPTTYLTGNSTFNSDQVSKNLRMESFISKAIGSGAGSHSLEMGGLFEWTSFRTFTESGPIVTDFRVVDDTGFGASFVPNPAGRIVDFGPPVFQDESTWYVSAFINDTWEVTENLTVNAGLRGDYQEFVGRAFIAPRFGFSLDPIGDGKTRFFGNWGIYHDKIFANALQWTASPDQLFQDILLASAFGQPEFRNTSIATLYKEALAAGVRPPVTADGVSYIRNITRDRFVLDDSLTAPANRQWAVGIERRLPANIRLQVTYTENKRLHQRENLVETVSVAQELGDFTIRDRIFATTGVGRFRQWAVEVQKPFSDRWEMNLSYVWSRNTGPVAPPPNPVDPGDVVSVNGTLGNDRTHVVKLQGRAQLPWKLEMGTDFTWQSGQPLTASIYTRDGDRLEPLGRNTLRYPSARQLNLNLRRPFQTADGKINIDATVKVFNVLNEFNVFGGFGLFETPDGRRSANPFNFPPLRPTVVPTDIDVPRSLELGFTVSF